MSVPETAGSSTMFISPSSARALNTSAMPAPTRSRSTLGDAAATGRPASARQTTAIMQMKAPKRLAFLIVAHPPGSSECLGRRMISQGTCHLLTSLQRRRMEIHPPGRAVSAPQHAR